MINTEHMELLKALELACQWITNDHKGTPESWKEYFLMKAREGIN
jgi:hypothetical protein